MSRKYKPSYAFADFDPVVYRAGYAAQKTNYHFLDENKKEISPVFTSAREATLWKQDFEEFDEDVSKWERVATKDYLTEKQAIKKFDDIVKEYRRLAGKTITNFKGYLTSREGKHKSLKGIEHEYQASRSGGEKPKHHDLLMAYAESLDFVRVSPIGYEADEVLIHNSEKYGADGVVLSIDKDMCTAEDTWVIHIQKDGTGRPVWNTALGHLELIRKSSENKGVGGGFKFLAYQAIAGDRSDGFFGAKGVGAVAAVKLIKDLETKEAIVEACIELYKGIYGEEYTYTSWDGEDHTKTTIELLEQHFEMPYMHRGNKDQGFDIYKYL